MTALPDRAQLEPFLAALDASPTALERPNCRGWIGDYQITGKHGHVLADHAGYLLYVTSTLQRWKKAKRILPGTVTQDGDDEGIVRLDRLPTPAEAELIRDLIGIRKRRHMTADALSSLGRAREAIKSPLLDSPIRYFEGADRSSPAPNAILVSCEAAFSAARPALAFDQRREVHDAPAGNGKKRSNQ